MESPAAAPNIQSLDSIMSKVASQTGIAADAPVAPAPAVQIVRDAPRMPLAEAPAAESPAPVEARDPSLSSAVAEAPADSANGIVSAEPTGEIVLDDGEVTLAAQRNADGTFKTKLDPTEKLDFTIKDKTTGEPKVYTKTLPEVVRLAKDGITLQAKLQEVQPEVEYYRESLPQWQQHTQQLTERLEAQEALNRELLAGDEALVLARRNQYREEMSPEKQLERLKAQMAEQEAQKTLTARQAQHAKIATSFMESRIAPSITAAQAVVGEMAVTGAVAKYTQDLLVNGVIPPANWPEMERRITSPTGPFQTWLKAESAKHSQTSDATTAAQLAAKEAQRKAQQVVNDQGRQMAPIGRAAPDSAPKQPTPQTVRGVLDRITNRPLPETVQRAG